MRYPAAVVLPALLINGWSLNSSDIIITAVKKALPDNGGELMQTVAKKSVEPAK
jgi:hypothetical protein